MSRPDIVTTINHMGDTWDVHWYDIPNGQPVPDLPWGQVYAVGNYQGLVPVVKYPDGHENLPGGKPEAGETIEETLAREVREEVNMSVHSCSPIGYQVVTLPKGIEVYQLRMYAVLSKIGEFSIDSGGSIVGHRLVKIGELNDTINYGLAGKRIIELTRHFFEEPER